MSTMKKSRERQEAREQAARAVLISHNAQVVPDQPHVTSLLSPYRPYFINHNPYVLKTKSSNKDKQLLELVKHHLAKYRVCPQLTNTWTRLTPALRRSEQGAFRVTTIKHGTIKGDWCEWYICVAQGGSLYKEHAKDYLTKKEVHTFLNCPHDLTVEQLLIYSAAKTFAENDGIALRLARSKLSEQGFTDFLKTVIYFFAKHPAASVAETNDLFDFIRFKHNEVLPPAANGTPAPKFTMAGATLESLRKKTQDWHWALKRVKVMGNQSWEGAPLDNAVYDAVSDHGERYQWFFNQIKTAKELAAEGNVMRHCVYSYRDRCVENKISVWSLSRADRTGVCTKKVTIELRNDGSIAQARGVSNRQLKPDEKHVIGKWAASNGLNFNSYY